MGELRGRAAALSEPALVFAGRALFPLPKQLFRLYTHLLRYLLKSEAFLSRASGTPARFHTEKRAYETEFGELTASTVAVVCGKVRLPRVGAAVFVALASKQSPEDWAHALVFRSDEKTEKLYAHLKEFHSANPTRFLPDRFIPHPVTKEAAMAEYRRCFPVTVFDMEMNYERPIQFAGRRLVLLPDGTVEEETPEQEAAEQIYAFLTKGGCFAGNALHNDLISLRAMFRRCGFPQDVLRRDIVDLTMAVRFDMGVANEPSLRLCMEHAGLAFSEDKFHDASYDTEGAARLFLNYIPGFIVKYGKAPLAPWDFFEPMREKEELDALYAETYIRPPKAEKKTGEGKSGDDPDGSA